MTINEQSKRLALLIQEFLLAQVRATKALQEINAICLLENEGNPLPSAIQGEDELIYFARKGNMIIKPGAFSDIVDEAKKTLDANGYVV